MKKIQKIINTIIKINNKSAVLKSKNNSSSLFSISQSQSLVSTAPVGFKSRSRSQYFYQ